MQPFQGPSGSPAFPAKGGRSVDLTIRVVASALLMVMMALTVCDVLGRYLFNAPVRGATEVTELLLAAVIFIGLPAVTLDREHITVDLLTDKLALPVRRILQSLMALVSAGVLGLIAWRLWVVAAQIGGYNGTTPSLKIPLAPLGYFMAFMCALAALILLVQAWPRKEQNDG